MRNMTPEERKQMYADIMKKLDDDFLDALKNGNWGTSVVTSLNSFLHPGMSPTDKDAKGMYEYQEPEVDEQGTYYGYKILRRHCNRPDCDIFVSPRYPQDWVNGEIHANRTPSEKSMFGIHCTKRPDHPELRNYVGRFHGSVYAYAFHCDDINRNESSFLVKCALSGDVIIETEQGFRAEHAQIVGVYINGNWQSYQDYQERTRAYTRPNPIYEEKEWRKDWRFDAGWDTSSDTNP